MSATDQIFNMIGAGGERLGDAKTHFSQLSDDDQKFFLTTLQNEFSTHNITNARTASPALVAGAIIETTEKLYQKTWQLWDSTTHKSDDGSPTTIVIDSFENFTHAGSGASPAIRLAGAVLDGPYRDASTADGYKMASDEYTANPDDYAPTATPPAPTPPPPTPPTRPLPPVAKPPAPRPPVVPPPPVARPPARGPGSPHRREVSRRRHELKQRPAAAPSPATAGGQGHYPNHPDLKNYTANPGGTNSSGPQTGPPTHASATAITPGDTASFTSGSYRYIINRGTDGYTMSYNDGRGHSGSFKPASLEGMGVWFRSNKGNLDDDPATKLDAVSYVDKKLGLQGRLNESADVPVREAKPAAETDQRSFWQKIKDADKDVKKNHAPTPAKDFSAPNG